MRRPICAALCALAILATASGSAAAITFTPSSVVATNLGRVRLTDTLGNVAECDMVSTLHILNPIALPLINFVPEGWVDGITFSSCASPFTSIQAITTNVLGGRLGAYGWPVDLQQILGTLGSNYTGGQFVMTFSVQLIVLGNVSCRYDGTLNYLMERGHRKLYSFGIRLNTSTCASWARNATGATFSPSVAIS